MPLNADITFLETKWKNLIADLNPEVTKKWFSFILTQYSEKHRFYHNLGHIQDLLKYSEQYKTELENAYAVQYAIWFHDVVYDPKSKENEIKSNELWLDFAQEAGITDKNTLNLVQAMILGSTKHTLESIPEEILTKNDKDILYFFDFDLSVLSAESEIYQEYAQSIRKEYIHVPDTLYKEGRTKVLETFLLRKIYSSAPFQSLEKQAKENIKQELMKLKNMQ